MSFDKHIQSLSWLRLRKFPSPQKCFCVQPGVIKHPSVPRTEGFAGRAPANWGSWSPLSFPFRVSLSSPVSGDHWSAFCHYKFSFFCSRISCEWNHMICFYCIWPLLFSVMFLRFIHVVDLIICLLHLIWIHNSLFIHSPVVGHLTCFWFLSVLSIVAMNVYLHVFLQACVYISLQ